MPGDKQYFNMGDIDNYLREKYKDTVGAGQQPFETTQVSAPIHGLESKVEESGNISRMIGLNENNGFYVGPWAQPFYIASTLPEGSNEQKAVYLLTAVGMENQAVLYEFLREKEPEKFLPIGELFYQVMKECYEKSGRTRPHQKAKAEG